MIAGKEGNRSENASLESDYDRLKHLEMRVIELSHDARTSITAASGYENYLRDERRP